MSVVVGPNRERQLWLYCNKYNNAIICSHPTLSLASIGALFLITYLFVEQALAVGATLVNGRVASLCYEGPGDTGRCVGALLEDGSRLTADTVVVCGRE